jgi:nucleoid DNA-binding protein
MKKVFQEIADELQISPGLIEKIVNSQFKFVKDTMATGEKNKPETFKTIQLTHLGKLAVRKKKLEFYKKNQKKKKND